MKKIQEHIEEVEVEEGTEIPNTRYKGSILIPTSLLDKLIEEGREGTYSTTREGKKGGTIKEYLSIKVDEEGGYTILTHRNQVEGIVTRKKQPQTHLVKGKSGFKARVKGKGRPSLDNEEQELLKKIRILRAQGIL